jgi:hypothetical protein
MIASTSFSSIESFTVETNQVITCQLELAEQLPVANSKCTRTEKIAYLGFRLVDGQKGKYLAAKKKDCNGWSWALPRGAIVHLIHSTGTWKNRYHEYVQFFVVVEGRWEGVLQDEVRDRVQGPLDIKFVAINLKPIGRLSEKEGAEAEAEIRNAGYLPSMYDPVKLLWHYWIKLKVAQAAAAPAPAAGPQDVDQAIAELEKTIAEKERELAELRSKLEQLKRLQSISGRVASLEPAAPVEVKAWR